MWREGTYQSAVETLTSKGLVNLKDINVVDRKSGLFKNLGNRNGRTNPHNRRGNTSDRSSDKLSNDRKPILLSNTSSRKNHGSSTIRNLTRIPSMCRAVLAERGLELTKALDGCSWTDTIVSVDGDGLFVSGLGVGDFDGEGVNFGVKVALLLSLLGFSVGFGGEFILLSAGDVVLFRYILGRDSCNVRNCSRVSWGIPIGIRQSAASL
jgi:hypothetical protein